MQVARKTFSDPELGSFEMYRPKLNEKVWGLTNEWCDAVMFAQFDQALLEKDGQRARAIVSGRRVLRTQRGTGYVAKNRFALPATIDLDWKTFEDAAQPVTAGCRPARPLRRPGTVGRRTAHDARRRPCSATSSRRRRRELAPARTPGSC